jgi:phospholipid/cholesterol/gamma-HCH transport system ATP-binding protein
MGAGGASEWNAGAPQAMPPVAPATDSEPVVVFEDVSIGFGRNPVLDGISFRIDRGETRILLGPAGEGKSVLLKLVNGLLRPNSGKIFVFGKEISAMREDDLFELRGAIGTVFQEGALFDSLTVRDNVGYRLIEEHLPEDEITRRVTEALRFVELEQTLEKFPSQLSGGMRRRDRTGDRDQSEADSLRFADGRPGSDHVDHHHRTGDETA